MIVLAVIGWAIVAAVVLVLAGAALAVAGFLLNWGFERMAALLGMG